MAQVINTNISSLNAQRNLNSSQSALATSLQRLSSGLRINSAKDDAAGMAISDRMSSQIRGLNQAARNANDGISLSQTAEGGLSAINDNLQRMRELAIQSANATNSASDRKALDAEAKSLLAEITRVATTTQFNGLNLLDGTFSAAQFQVGANANQTIGVSMSAATTESLGAYGGKAQAVTSAAFASDNSIKINDIQIGATSDRSSQAAGWTDGSAAAKAAAINAKAAMTGVSATAITEIKGTDTVAPHLGSHTTSDDFKINGVAISSLTAQASASDQGRMAAAAINDVSQKTGVTATYDAGTGKLALSSAEGRDIKLEATDQAAATRIYNATGLLAGSVAGANTITLPTAGSSTITVGTAAEARTASVLINGVSFNFSEGAASNSVTDATNVSVVVDASADVTAVAAALRSAIATAKGNNLTKTALQTLTVASATTAVVTLNDSRLGTAATVGRTITTTSATPGMTLAVEAGGANMTVSGGTFAGNATTRGTLTLSASSSFSLTGVGASGLAASGLASYTVKQDQLATVALDSVEGANSAIRILDAALAQVNSQRADLGATQNRFSATVSNLQTSAENISAARSRIQDADFAAETAALTRNQILQQAGIAMLSQANALPQNVLSLLK